MRRDNRIKNNIKDNKQNKIIMYSIIGVAFLVIVLVGLLMYSKSLNEEMQNEIIDFEDMASETNENTSNNISNTNTESVSTQIGKNVNEAKNTSNTISNNVTNEKTTNNTTSNTVNSTKTEINKNVTANTNVSKETKKEETKKEETKKELSFEKPVEGEIMKNYAKDNLVYSETLQEWVTHLGIDIKADKTTVIKASEAGTVKTIKNDPRYGLTIIIEHDEGYQTVYANLLSSEFVIEGEKVEKGQSIGTVGNTATFEIADEPHLHFEILKDGVQIDPSNYIK